ncbi:MAG: GNAT family N-acetyltransferase [Prevotella sp.]|jgi:putative acetyltransferase
MQIEKLEILTDKLLDELLSVWEKSVRSSHHFLKEEDVAYYKYRVRNQYFQAVELYVIRNGKGRIAALMGLSDDTLEMLFVLPEEQGQGYGKALVKYAIKECKVYKVDVNEDNKQAYRFYLRRGYQVIGRDELDPCGKPFPILHLQHLS